MTTGSSDFIDIACEVRHRSDRAVLIFDGTRQVWLPKSLVEENDDGTVTLPVWLATQKELV